MMFRRMLKSKIHRARVTHADLDYEGSVTVSPELLKMADILPNEAVNIWNVTAGTRFETYTILGKEQSSDLCINGAAARLVSPGDIVIIASFVQLAEEHCSTHTPIVVFVDQCNQFREIRPELNSLEGSRTMSFPTRSIVTSEG